MNYRGENRRQHERRAVNDALMISVIKLLPSGTTIQAMIVNSSAHGIQISLAREIAVHDKVEIAINNQLENSLWRKKCYAGRVCWCMPDDHIEDLFNAGILFLELQSVE